MALTIGSNIASLRAQRELGESTNSLSQVFERLSSGQRINRASDDAASLSVALGLDSRSTVLTQAVRNVNDGISALNLVDSALFSLSNVTQRQVELAEQAANGSLSYEQREALNAEYNELVREYNRITASTEFNDISLLSDPDNTNIRIQVGGGSESTDSIGFDIGEELERLIGTGEFDSQGSFSPSSSIGDIYLADVNNDGFADLIQPNGGNIGVSLGDGTGSFGSTFTLTGVPNITGTASDVFLEDLNGDGNLDLIASNTTGRAISLGNGDGTFQTASSISFGSTTDATAVQGDFNGDGNLDFAYFMASDGVLFEYGNGDGTFSSIETLSGSFDEIAAGDFNGDGQTDLFIEIGGNGYIYQRSGSSFEQVADIGATGSIQDAFFFDTNQDGLDDLVFTSGNTDVQIRLSNGDGTFATGETLSQSANITDIDIGDFNGDGLLDISTGNVSGALRVFTADGDGSFTEFGSVGGTGLSEYGQGDINGDGVLDFIRRSLTSSMESLLQSSQGANTQALEDITTQSGARSALTTAQANLERISLERGALGAVQSRFESAINSISAEVDNIKAASSRIKDADIAAEAAELTRLSILQNAAQAVLSQANQQPALALNLLSQINSPRGE